MLTAWFQLGCYMRLAERLLASYTHLFHQERRFTILSTYGNHPDATKHLENQLGMSERSQDFGEGGAEYAREASAQFLATPTYKKWKGPSSNHHRERVLTVASELESTFLTEFRDKPSLWLSSKLFFL